MPASTIIVQYGDGSPARRVRVRLELPAGMTADVYTNDHGEAVVEHATTGRATVYVSGAACGTFHAPGRTAVTIR